MTTPIFSATDTDTTGTATVSVTVTTTIPAGSLVAVAANRTIGGSSTSTEMSASDSKGNAYTVGGASTRSGAHNMALMYSVTNTPLVNGDSITVTFADSHHQRKVMAVGAWGSRFASSVNATSGVHWGGPSTSAGDHGNSANPTTSTQASSEGGLILSAFTINLGRTFTPSPGTLLVAEDMTSVGSNDRGVALCYRYAMVDEIHTSSGTYAPSGSGWAAASIVMTDDNPSEPGAGGYGDVLVGGSKRPVTDMHVMVGGSKRPVVNAWVIVGGSKRPLQSG